MHAQSYSRISGRASDQESFIHEKGVCTVSPGGPKTQSASTAS